MLARRGYQLARSVFGPQETAEWLSFLPSVERGGVRSLLDEAMASELEEVKQRLGVKGEGSATLSDVALYALAALGGVLTGAMMMAVLLSPVTLVLWWRGRSQRPMPAS